jgi:hypothetical protein
MRVISAVVVTMVLAVLAAGCKREAPINGIGGFEIGKTQLGQLSGRCFPDEQEPLMRCPIGVSAPLGAQKGDIELYFGGKNTDSTLVEILLDVMMCQPPDLERYLVSVLGEPGGRTATRVWWVNEFVYISASVPPGASSCEVNFVSIQDKKRIEDLGGQTGQPATK